MRTLDLGPLGMALRAHQWNVERGDGRVTVFQGQDVMIAVAVLTMGRVLVAGPHPLSVRAGPIRGERAVVIFVTLSALDAPKPRRMRIFLGFVELRVAAHAIERRVSALRKPLRLDRQGDAPSVALDPQARIPVAFEANRKSLPAQ